MNQILNSSQKRMNVNSILKIMNNKIIKKCGPSCICLFYLDLSDKRSQIYYENCYLTKTKINYFRGPLPRRG